MHTLSSLLNFPIILAQAGEPAPELDATSVGLMAGGGILGILAMVVGAASLVIAIIVLIKQFKNDPAWHGIVGIITCGLYTYIWGWINSTRLQLKKLMLVWTALWVVGIGLQVVIIAMVGGAAAKQIKAEADRAKAEQAAPVPEQN